MFHFYLRGESRRGDGGHVLPFWVGYLFYVTLGSRRVAVAVRNMASCPIHLVKGKIVA